MHRDSKSSRVQVAMLDQVLRAARLKRSRPPLCPQNSEVQLLLFRTRPGRMDALPIDGLEMVEWEPVMDPEVIYMEGSSLTQSDPNVGSPALSCP